MAQRRMQDVFALDDLRLISAIGEAGTLTGAARLLAVDHSTAFRRLGALETRLGAPLFERDRSGSPPTKAGDGALATAAGNMGEAGDIDVRLAGGEMRRGRDRRGPATDKPPGAR